MPLNGVTCQLGKWASYSHIFEYTIPLIEVAIRGVLWKRVFLKISQNAQGNTCARVSFLQPQACNFIKKETLAKVFICEFCEISKNTFFQRTPVVVASAPSLQISRQYLEINTALPLRLNLTLNLIIKPL